MKDLRFSRWWGPLIGALAGGDVSEQAAEWLHKFDSRLAFFLYGLVGGAAVGCLVLLADPPAPKETLAISGEATAPVNHGSLVGRVLSILGLVLFLFPILGFVVNLAALMLNWRVKGWPKVVAGIGFGLSSSITGLILAMIGLGKFLKH